MAPGSTGHPGAYPLMFDTRISASADRTGGPSPASESTSAVDRSRFPPGPLEAGTSQSLSSKRPANWPIHPTAEKRPRTNGTSDQSKSAASVNAAVLRTNAIAGPVGATLSRLSSFMSPLENVIHPSRDPRIQARAPAGSASPIHVASPLSITNGDAGQHDSGNTTPVQGAPLAPSMVSPTVPFPLKRPTDNGVKRSVASIRQAALKKQTLSAAASENVALASIRAKNIELQNELKIERSERSRLENRLQQLEQKLEQPQMPPSDPNLLKKVEDLSESVHLLQKSQQDPLTDEIAVSTLVERVMGSVKSDVKSVFDNELEDRVKQAVQSAIPDVSAVQSEVETSVKNSVDTAIKSQNATLNALSKGPNSLENRLKQLFQTDIKSLKKDVSGLTKDSDSFDDKVKKLMHTDITALQNHFKKLDNKVTALEKKKGKIESDTGSTKSNIDELKKDLANVTAELKKAEIARDADVVSNKKRLDDLITKLNDADQYMDSLKEEDLPKKLTALKKELSSQKTSNAQRFTKLEGADSVQQKLLGETVKTVIKQMKLVLNNRVAEVNEDIHKLQKATDDIVQEIAKIRQAADQNEKAAQTSLADLKYSISTTASTLRAEFYQEQSDLRSSISTAANILRTEFQQEQSAMAQDSEQNPSMTDVRICVEEVRSAIMSDTKETQGCLEKEISRLQSEISCRLETAAGRSENTDLQQLREDAEKALDMAESAQNLVNGLSQNLIGEVEMCIDQKVHELHQAIEGQLNIMKSGIHSIEDRYQNITTDELYQRMVHWFTQNYPNASDLFNKLNALEGSVHRIGMFTNTIAWINDGHNGQLRSLIDHHDAINQFFAGAEGQSLGAIQKSMADLSQTLRTLQPESKTECTNRTLLAKDLSKLQERIGPVENKVGDFTAWKADLEPRWETQQRSSHQMECTLLAILIDIFEVQEAIKTINKQLKGGGFNLKFSHDFSKPLNP
ncbi:hypothetical protein BU23DRAFT_570945 [Bimuria novae-zelandiae CBS 107.79]|uniref:Uncharacterized protein n=1 Tax=Bimuria novae-zelandiae CBS 107.79 TaxID=1447943 RepID=A0A6A5VA30_9PLEO|nr:hypothetical protein BU23DRAFT_570945 [Bimuria novae-zelandiae CBS 107.79]